MLIIDIVNFIYIYIIKNSVLVIFNIFIVLSTKKSAFYEIYIEKYNNIMVK